MDRYRELFLDESLKHLEATERLLGAPGDLSREALDVIFRETHSLKGMAASMGYRSMADLAHRLEDRFHAWREGSAVPRPEDLATALRVCDRLADMRGDIGAGGDGELDWQDLAELLSDHPAVPSAPAEQKAPSSLDVRIDIDPECGSPSARAYLILLRFRGLDPQLSSDPAEEEILRGRGVFRIDLTLHGVSREAVETLCDSLTEVAALSFPGPEEAPVARREGTPPPSRLSERSADDARAHLPETVQTPVRLLDEFVDLVGEMTLSRSHLEDMARGLDSEILRDEVDRLGTLIRSFHERVMKLRMLPFALITGGLKRVVRDLSGRLGKDVALHISGEEIGMDKSILLRISDPLTHLLRNAVDHGIEDPAERQQKGKPPAGQIRITAARSKNQIEITVADDGRGIDVESVRRKIVETGLLGEEEGLRLRSRDVFSWLFRAGFSTRSEVSEVSGRGVGLDVVKSDVEAVGGNIELASSLGAGAEFRLSLPLSVAIIPVLTVAVGSLVLALPVTAIAKTMEALPRDVREKEGHHVLLTEQGSVPIRSLARILRLEGKKKFERMPLALVHGPSGMVALAVDRFLKEEDLFIKPFRGPLRRLAGLSGYSVVGDGSLVFLLDPVTLLGD